MLKSDADKWNEYYDEAIAKGHDEVTADFIADQKLEGWKREFRECAMEDQEDDRRHGI